jgi:hypothetical protein
MFHFNFIKKVNHKEEKKLNSRVISSKFIYCIGFNLHNEMTIKN